MLAPPIELQEEYELERGKPTPSKNHGLVQALLIMALFHYRQKFTILSEVALRFGEFQATPDICIYPPLSLDWIHDEIRLTDPPLIAIEILSPRQYLSDLIAKFEIYFTAGVQSCWLVQPALLSIAVFTPDMTSTIYTAGTFTDPATGIEINLADIFPLEESSPTKNGS